MKQYMLSTVTGSFGNMSESVPAVLVTNTLMQLVSGSARASAGSSADIIHGQTVLRTEFTSNTTNPKPANIGTNTYVIGPLSGVVPMGNWSLSYRWRATASLSSDWACLYKIYTGPDPATAAANGPIHSGTTDTHTANLASGGEGVVTDLIGLGEVTLRNEYIYLATAMMMVTPSTNDGTSSRNLALKIGADCYLEFPDLQPLGEVLIGMVGI